MNVSKWPVLLFLVAVPVMAEDEPATPAAKLVASDTPLVIAHRGYSSIAPENTLVAFNFALRAKADLVELDYFETDHGDLVVFHDQELDRTTNAKHKLGGKKIIWETPLADLRKLDAGSWKNQRFRGAKIPTLAESIKLIQKGSVTLIEHKRGSAESCLKVLEQGKWSDSVVVQSFDWDFIADVRRQAPGVATAALGKDEMTPEKVIQVRTLGCPVIGWNHKDVTKKQIDLAHEAGLKIWVYTVNDPRRARSLLKDGIDGIITDDPGLIMGERAELLR